VPGGAIYEDDFVYGEHAQIREGESSAYLGYLMVETKRHIPSLSDLTDNEAQTIGLVIASLSQALKAVEDVEHV
jgi:histidine triad (HIT) family protein